MSQGLPSSVTFRAQASDPAASESILTPGFAFSKASLSFFTGTESEPAWKIIIFLVFGGIAAARKD